jgi:predicted metallo-beta-lactamase superfamily hydrolase
MNKMNEQIRELAILSGLPTALDYHQKRYEKFAELIIEECRNVLTEVYRNTPLDLFSPLLTADEEIVKRFYRVEE